MKHDKTYVLISYYVPQIQKLQIIIHVFHELYGKLLKLLTFSKITRDTVIVSPVAVLYVYRYILPTHLTSECNKLLYFIIQAKKHYTFPHNRLFKEDTTIQY